jgi:hypothetical protein
MKQVTQTQKIEAKRVRRLVDRTGSLFPWERKKARAALLALGSAAVDPLLALYERERRTGKKRTNIYNYLAYAGAGMLVISLCGRQFPGVGNQFLGDMGGVALAMLLSAAILRQTPRESRRQALLANALALFDDCRILGPLIEALRFKLENALFPVKTRRPAIDTLTLLLPRLQPDQDDLLNAEHRAMLYRELRPLAHSEFVVEILGALTRLGDTKAIPYVRRMAQYSHNRIHTLAQLAPHRAEKILRTHTLAQGCLAQLEAIAEQERQSQTLLRATATEAETPQTVLLRAAQAGNATDPKQLLRATQANTTQEPEA